MLDTYFYPSNDDRDKDASTEKEGAVEIIKKSEEVTSRWVSEGLKPTDVKKKEHPKKQEKDDNHRLFLDT